MSKIDYKIVRERHGYENFVVKRPYGNECLVIPEENESADSIIKSIQQAVRELSSYVVNCPIGNWTGRATTYITIQPIKDPLREEVSNRLKEISGCGNCLMREHDFDGRLQLILYTPSPMNRPIKADDERIYNDDRFNKYGKYIISVDQEKDWKYG